MKRFVVFTLALALAAASSFGQSVRWKKVGMDASRTGVVASNSENVKESMGSVKGCRYTAPDGKVFKGSVRNVAKAVLAAQPAMKDVKEAIAKSDCAMIRTAPECELSDWYIDVLMSETSRLTGKKIDAGIVNHGGIRVDMPEGTVLADDIMSMFPFKNRVTIVTLKGARLREILEEMAARKIEVIGGIRITVKDKILVSALVGGEPLDDGRTYNLVTIDFLLEGGDNLTLGKDAVSVDITDMYVIDVVLPYVRNLAAQGKTISYKIDNRVTIL